MVNGEWSFLCLMFQWFILIYIEEKTKEVKTNFSVF